MSSRRGDPDHAIAVFGKQSAEVNATVPSPLLVSDIHEGLQPLCIILGQPLVAEPFPKASSTAEFQSMFARGGL